MAVQEKTTEIFTSNLVCQRCSNPLKLNRSFKEIDDEIFDELSHPINLNADQDDRNVLLPIVKKKHESTAMRNLMIPANLTEASDFMVVGELASLPLENAQSLMISDTISSLISDHSTIDHPLCEDCTDKVLDQMDSQLRVSKTECKMYQLSLEELKKVQDEEDVVELQAELQKLKKEEAFLEAQLQELETKQETTKGILESYKKDAAILAKAEKKHWNEYYHISHQILMVEDGERSCNNQLMYVQAQLNKLMNTDVFEHTFHIWHSGHFGTINTFRLGRLPKEPVEWTEINAAWGQTVLLLHSLAMTVNLTFERFKLVPYGNHSYIVPLDNKTKYLPLYCLGGNMYYLDDRFNDAMVAFLDCLQQFLDEVQLQQKLANDPNLFHLPYKMDKGRIEDKNNGKSYSIKIYFNSEEQWTKALKYMLTNLKWAMTWVREKAI